MGTGCALPPPPQDSAVRPTAAQHDAGILRAASATARIMLGHVTTCGDKRSGVFIFFGSRQTARGVGRASRENKMRCAAQESQSQAVAITGRRRHTSAALARPPCTTGLLAQHCRLWEGPYRERQRQEHWHRRHRGARWPSKGRRNEGKHVPAAAVKLFSRQ